MSTFGLCSYLTLPTFTLNWRLSIVACLVRFILSLPFYYHRTELDFLGLAELFVAFAVFLSVVSGECSFLLFTLFFALCFFLVPLSYFLRLFIFPLSSITT